MAEFFLKLAVTAISLAASVRLIEGITFTGKWWTMLVIALIFGLVNSIIKPVVKLFSLPFLILTLGLFSLVINALMLKLTAWLSGGMDLGFFVNGFWPAVKGALVVSIVNFLLTCLIGLRE